MDQIRLQNIEPAPLRGFFDGSQIWAQIVSFEKGNKYLVYAPSGKGKTTFLHILYGLRNDFEGSVLYNDIPISNLTIDDWSQIRQSDLSIVFQNLRLFPELTAYHNIQLKNQLTQNKTRLEIEGLAEDLGIKALLEKPVAQLSFGQKQRVAIIRSLCQPYSFLLLDEPFSHLDPENRSKAISIVRKDAERQGAGIILVNLEEEDVFENEIRLRL